MGVNSVDHDAGYFLIMLCTVAAAAVAVHVAGIRDALIGFDAGLNPGGVLRWFLQIHVASFKCSAVDRDSHPSRRLGFAAGDDTLSHFTSHLT
jgi:hypothetical protein